ncbi:uncharacterized protein F5147DRAFT_772862 [Suillus discolor]|uniref:Uncharacterized protein n=1 Tax=Suillus discolor TaxID=1912936 RepID=A0A9P7F9Q6_9AGAM|nr:uncharacterized protein F5147DRAFT_772862 [Suillus discolor]KAG2109554.1 hypothetical protein F5147DRAFT_772862 [Suillus discolor]
MPTGCHARTIDLGKKLSSFLTAPPIHNTKVMDELTTSELNRLILQEPPFMNRDELSHALALIFQSCTTKIPKVKDLMVPLSKIPPSARLDDLEVFTPEPDRPTMVRLYDIKKCQWNWPLPMTYELKRKHPTTKQSKQGGKSGTEDSEKSGEWVLIDETTKTKLASGSLDAPSLASTSEASKSMLPFADAELLTDESESDDRTDDLEGSLPSYAVLEEGSPMTEHIFTSFFNIVAIALLALKPDLAHPHNLSYTWSAANSSRPVPGDEVPCKPDLILLDDVEARWDTIKAVCELTCSTYKPSSTLAKTLNTKAYLLLKHQPWRQFALMVSVCNGYHDLRIHLYDHSSDVMLRSCATFILHQNETSPHRTQSESSSHSSPSQASTCTLPHQMDLEMETAEDKSTEEDEANTPAKEDKDKDKDKVDKCLIELPIEIPNDPLLEPLPEPIRKIWVNDHYYDILEIIFSRQGLVGHGTVCYLAKMDGQDYIIKDY